MRMETRPDTEEQKAVIAYVNTAAHYKRMRTGKTAGGKKGVRVCD